MVLSETQTAAVDSSPLLVPVAPWKLLLMSMVSFGLYEVYWRYRQWQQVREALGESIWPFGRALFLPFSFLFLLRDAAEIWAKRGVPQWTRPQLIGSTYFLLAVASNCAGFLSPLFPVGITPLRVLPLLIFQRQVNQVNRAARPGTPIDDKLTWINWLCILGFIAILGIEVLGDLTNS